MTHPVPKTVGQLLDLRARTTPDERAYLYLGDTDGERAFTYAELRAKALGIAARLRESGQRGERVLLLYPPGLEFITGFLGCMAAGAIAVPAPPPNILKPKRSLERLGSIIDSAWPTWALTTSSMFAALKPALAETRGLDGIQWVVTDGVPAAPANAPPFDPVAPESIALIQYTSGSTSDPKGAALSHANVLHNIAYFDDGWDHGNDAVSVNWLPAFHDLGLLYGILAPLWRGQIGIQMSPIDVILKPFVWLEAMSTHHATHSSGPNFIYDLCVRKVTDSEVRSLDLSRWRVALTAAEPVRAETMRRFVERFAEAGFRGRTFCPGYGLSESTCKVAAVASSDEPTVLHVAASHLERHRVEISAAGAGTLAVVGCGRPGRGVAVAIVDPDTRRRRGPTDVGEIWVSGPNIAASYWNQPAATEQQLRAKIEGGDATPHLRTGDLGFVHKGELFITGRVKDMIIVRGNNHYPQDIEYSVQDAHPSIRAGCCAAFAIEEDGEERLCIVAEVERRVVDTRAQNGDRRDGVSATPRPAAAVFAAEDVVASITSAVAEVHGIKVHRVELIRAGTIPKTTSGKIQRRACREAMLRGKLDRLATGDNDGGARAVVGSARDLLRSRISEMVSRCGSIPRDKLRPSESLHRFGVDSLAGVNIAYEVGLLIKRDVPSGLVAEHDTIEKLVDYVLAAGFTP